MDDSEGAIDWIRIANGKSLEGFIEAYLPKSSQWKTWTHPRTKATYSITLSAANALSDTDFDACFRLIELTSSKEYKKSRVGWNVGSKKKEMQLLDLKYFLVKLNNFVEGFVSLMPTYEDDYPVVYCYEIHLSLALQGTGLGSILMNHLKTIGANIPETKKIMLTCFIDNTRGIKFYEKLGYVRDEFSPSPRVLRNGTKVEPEYVILSKPIAR